MTHEHEAEDERRGSEPTMTDPTRAIALSDCPCGMPAQINLIGAPMPGGLPGRKPLYGESPPQPQPAEAGKVDVVPASRAAVDVLAERQRQISAEGWTPEHDDEHDTGELAIAAGCYAIHAHQGFTTDDYCNDGSPAPWPWGGCAWKPKDARRDLVRAGALILAEIERLDRLAAKREGV